MSNGVAVLLVMKRLGNIRVLKQTLAEKGFSANSVSDEAELALALDNLDRDAVGLVDVSGFGSAAWRMCEMLHSRRVRFVVLSEAKHASRSSQAMACGAVSIFEKPVGKSALLQLLQTLAQ